MFSQPQSFLDIALYNQYKTILGLILIFIVLEWQGREQPYALATLGLKWPKYLRYAMYYIIVLAIFWFGGKEQDFIYFQF
jgi:hypothetical protein